MSPTNRSKEAKLRLKQLAEALGVSEDEEVMEDEVAQLTDAELLRRLADLADDDDDLDNDDDEGGQQDAPMWEAPDSPITRMSNAQLKKELKAVLQECAERRRQRLAREQADADDAKEEPEQHTPLFQPPDESAVPEHDNDDAVDDEPPPPSLSERERWEERGVAAMRKAIEREQTRLWADNLRRVRDADRAPPPGWRPRPPVFGSNATPDLRDACGGGRE
jgi:hypothetical protein